MTVFSQELSKMNEELLRLSVTMQQEKDTLIGWEANFTSSMLSLLRAREMYSTV